MKAWTLKPLKPGVEESIRERLDPDDPELKKARIRAVWREGVLWIRHPNFKWVLGRKLMEEAKQNARREAVKMLPEYTIDEDYEVEVL